MNRAVKGQGGRLLKGTGKAAVRGNTRGLVSQPTATAVVDQVGFFTATLTAAACPACQSPQAATRECVEDPSQQTTVHGLGERQVHIMDGSPHHISPDPSASQEPSETLFGVGGQAGA